MKLIHKASAAIVAGLLMVGNAAPALAADAPQPSAGTQTGSGSTNVTVISKMAGQEAGGAGGLNNPDVNEDGLGDNIAFTVPSSINFVVDAQGTLTGPSADATYIENKSSFAIHASSFDVDASNGWAIEAQSETTHAQNSANFQFGPTGDILDAAAYLDKTPVAHPAVWNMSAEGVSGATNKVQMSSSGHLYNVTKDLSSEQQIAVIKTYVTVGSAS